MSKLRFIIFLIIISISLVGCATFYNPATGKKETVLLDTASEVALGRSLTKEVESKFKIDNNSAYNERVQTIGQKIVTYCDRQDIFYEFKVVKDKEINAFALPGGFTYFNRGLLDATNDEELAAVIAHEIGHIVARHGVKKLQTQLGVDLLVSIVLGRQNEQELRRLLGLSFNILSLGYSRKDELQADRLGIRYMGLAGYNRQGMVSLFEKLKNKYGDVAGFEIWMSDHPPLSERIEKAKEEIENIAKAGQTP